MFSFVTTEMVVECIRLKQSVSDRKIQDYGKMRRGRINVGSEYSDMPRVADSNYSMQELRLKSNSSLTKI